MSGPSKQMHQAFSVLFLSRVNVLMHTERDTVTAIPSVCPSFRPVPVLCLNKCTYRHTFFQRSSNRIVIVFLSASAVTKFKILHGNQTGREENFYKVVHEC